jgi:putative serine protease PepD
MFSTRKRAVAGLGAALMIGAGAGIGGYTALDNGNSSSTAASSAPVGASSPIAATSSELSVNEIYRRANPGVVDITVTSAGSGQTPFPSGGQSQAEGSGFVIDSKGDIVTNEHVVDGATAIKVRFASGKTVTATLVGSDSSTDIAVIKVSVPADELKPIDIGDSSTVQVGDGVVAIGSPFGLAGTVTTGIVSALGRTIQAPNDFSIRGAIQTDAAINHGNSGGPLLNLQGDVIGVNAQIQSDSGGNDGVGFAIPSNTVKSVAQQLITSGKVTHAFLGVSLNAGTTTVAEVRAGTPADNAGIQAGDVIVSIDGQKVSSTSALQSAIDAKKPGDKIQVTFTRNGAQKSVTVTLGTRPS